jgi:hypothetical protein
VARTYPSRACPSQGAGERTVEPGPSSGPVMGPASPIGQGNVAVKPVQPASVWARSPTAGRCGHSRSPRLSPCPTGRWSGRSSRWHAAGSGWVQACWHSYAAHFRELSAPGQPGSLSWASRWRAIPLPLRLVRAEVFGRADHVVVRELRPGLPSSIRSRGAGFAMGQRCQTAAPAVRRIDEAIRYQP